MPRELSHAAACPLLSLQRDEQDRRCSKCVAAAGDATDGAGSGALADLPRETTDEEGGDVALVAKAKYAWALPPAALPEVIHNALSRADAAGAGRISSRLVAAKRRRPL